MKMVIYFIFYTIVISDVITQPVMGDENKGLASADEETKQRVAKKGGEARAQDKEGLSEAGRKGGEQ